MDCLLWNVTSVVVALLFNCCCPSMGVITDLGVLRKQWYEVLLKGPLQVSLMSGQMASLDCTTQFHAKDIIHSVLFHYYDVVWLRGDGSHVISGSDGRKIIYSKPRYRNYLLEIKNVEANDAGYYACALWNPNEAESRSFSDRRLLFLTSFVITVTPCIEYKIQSKEFFQSFCQADRLAESLNWAGADLSKWTLSWSLNKHVFTTSQLLENSSSSALTIGSIQPKHSGEWTCSVDFVISTRGGNERVKLIMRSFRLEVIDGNEMWFPGISAEKFLFYSVPLMTLTALLLVTVHILMGVLFVRPCAQKEVLFRSNESNNIILDDYIAAYMDKETIDAILRDCTDQEL